MATYIILNTLFIAVVILLLKIPLRKPSKSWVMSLVVLLVMTAVFDSLIIAYSLVAYDTTKLLGLYIGKAPVEDFFYAVLAMLIVPIIYNRLKSNNDSND